jgi:hypothetical protein
MAVESSRLIRPGKPIRVMIFSLDFEFRHRIVIPTRPAVQVGVLLENTIRPCVLGARILRQFVASILVAMTPEFVLWGNRGFPSGAAQAQTERSTSSATPFASQIATS